MDCLTVQPPFAEMCSLPGVQSVGRRPGCLCIESFHVRFRLIKSNPPLPESLTLRLLTGNNASEVKSDSDVVVKLRRAVEENAAAAAAAVEFGSRKRGRRVHDGNRFEVYVRKDKILEGSFRKVGEEWMVLVSGVCEDVAAVRVEVEGGPTLFGRIRRRFCIESFHVRFLRWSNQPLPESLTLRVISDSDAVVTLHRVVEEKEAVAAPVFGSEERGPVYEGVRFEVYLREDRILEARFGKVGEEWKVLVRGSGVFENVAAAAEVRVGVEGGPALVGRIRRRFCIESFHVRFLRGLIKSNQPLPESLTLRDKSDSGAVKTLHRVAEEEEAVAVFGSQERGPVYGGTRFGVYVREDRILKVGFRKVGEEWKVWVRGCRDVCDDAVVVEVRAAVNGGPTLVERAVIMGRRRRRLVKMEVIREEEVDEEESDGQCKDEESDGQCCFYCKGDLDGGGLMGSYGPDVELTGWAVDVSIWVLMGLGVGLMVTIASLKSLRRLSAL